MFMWGVSLTDPELWGVSFTHPILVSLLSEEFPLHIPCWFHFYVGSSSYTPRDCFLFIWGVSLTHPKLALYFFREFCYTYRAGFILFLGSLSYTSHSDFFKFFILVVSFTRPMLASFFKSGEFLLHIPSWLELYLGCFTYTPNARFIFMWGVSLTHPVLASYLSGEFLLHIPCRLYFYLGLHFYVGSFSYTARAGLLYFYFHF